MAKKLVPVFVGYMKKCDGISDADVKISPKSQSAFNEHSKNFKDDEQVKLTVSRLTEDKIRSVVQNNYYRGVVIKILAEHFGHIGPGEKEELHNSLRTMFLVRTTKLGLKVVETTTVLDTKLFERYLQAIRDWALAEHQCYIPKPNEVEEEDEFTKI